ncbi:uncharacterized protein DS421_18g630390 [Arachis hypogaea]|nr:uncharacterized protein DS421_18g630390 [Arachis hypogaea]
MVLVSSPLSTLNNYDIANFASEAPRSLSNVASASAILPCYIIIERNHQVLCEVWKPERYKNENAMKRSKKEHSKATNTRNLVHFLVKESKEEGTNIPEHADSDGMEQMAATPPPGPLACVLFSLSSSMVRRRRHWTMTASILTTAVTCDDPSSDCVDYGGPPLSLPLSLSRVWLDDVPLSQHLLPLLLDSDNDDVGGDGDGGTQPCRCHHLPLFFSLRPRFLFSSFLSFFLSNRG